MTLLNIGIRVTVAIVVSTVATWAVRAFALRRGVVARPREERWHRSSTPMMGGVGIAVAFLVTLVAFRPTLDSSLAAVLAGSACMFLLGFVDDLVQLRPLTKFAGQLAICAAVLFFAKPLPVFPFAPLNVAITVLWLIGITNAFNLLDNMNGLSGGVAVLVAVFRAALFAYEGQPVHAAVCLMFAGSIVGFLFFNFPRGLIFMGDCGSLFLGFFLASITLTGFSAFTKNVLAVLIFPAMLMLVPIFDTTMVTIMRRLGGRPVSMGGRDHLSHRLVSYGLRDDQAVLVLWSLCVLSGCIGFLFIFFDPGRLVSVLFLLGTGVVLFGIYLSRFESTLVPKDAKSRRRVLLSPYLQSALSATFDVSLMIASYYTAMLLHYEGVLQSSTIDVFFATLPALVLVKLGTMIAFGAYRTYWKYFGIEDALTFAKGSAAATVFVVFYFAFIYRLNGVSRSALAFDWVLFTLFAISFRLSFRILDRLAPDTNGKKKILIYPVNEQSVEVLRYILDKRVYTPVGFVSAERRGRSWSKIHGVPVVGGAADIASIIQRTHAEILLISCELDPAHAPVVEACREAGLTVCRAELQIVELRPEHERGVPAVAGQ